MLVVVVGASPCCNHPTLTICFSVRTSSEPRVTVTVFCILTLLRVTAKEEKDDLRSETANVTEDDITSQHSAILAMCCQAISSFVIFPVLDLRVGGCRP